MLRCTKSKIIQTEFCADFWNRPSVSVTPCNPVKWTRAVKKSALRGGLGKNDRESWQCTRHFSVNWITGRLKIVHWHAAQLRARKSALPPSGMDIENGRIGEWRGWHAMWPSFCCDLLITVHTTLHRYMSINRLIHIDTQCELLALCWTCAGTLVNGHPGAC